MSDYFDFKKAVKIALTTLVFLSFGFMFFPFWKPILVAALFGFALVDVVEYFSSKHSRGVPTVLILLGFCLILVLPLLFIILKISRSVLSLDVAKFSETSLYKSIEDSIHRLQDSLQTFSETVGMEVTELPKPLTLMTKALSWIMNEASAIAGNVPQLFLSLFVFAIALYYFLTEARSIKIAFIRLHILDRKELDEIITIIKKTSYRTLIASAVVGAVQGSIVAFGALAFGYYEFILVFIITFFVSFIPVIGAAPVAVVLALISLVNGSVGSAIGLLIVAAVAGSIDNFLKPYLVSSANESKVHPVVSLLAIVGAVIVYGLPGLLLGPILMELAVKIVPVFFYKDLPPEIKVQDKQLSEEV